MKPVVFAYQVRGLNCHQPKSSQIWRGCTGCRTLRCFCYFSSHATRRTSHVTHRTSHIARHTSHIARHTSHVTRHTCFKLFIRQICLCRSKLSRYGPHTRINRPINYTGRYFDLDLLDIEFCEGDGSGNDALQFYGRSEGKV